MKRIFILPVLIAFIFSFSGCEKDESLDPRPLLVQGQFMRLDITRQKINIDDIDNSSFGGMLTNPSNDVVKYELLVRLKRAYIAPDDLGNPAVLPFESDYVALRTITAFPIDLSIVAQDVVDAYAAVGTTINVIRGDEFYFIAYSYDALGNRIVFRDLSLTVRGEPAYKQAYKFNTLVTTTANLNGEYTNYKP